MRQVDIEECGAYGLSPYEGVMEGFSKSDCKSVFVDGVLTAIFGIFPDPTRARNGIIWLLGTDNIKLFSKEFLRNSKEEFKKLLTPYETASNYILKANTIHIRWVSWLGFLVEPYSESFNKITYTK
jgi:hypothetical protein